MWVVEIAELGIQYNYNAPQIGKSENDKNEFDVTFDPKKVAHCVVSSIDFVEIETLYWRNWFKNYFTVLISFHLVLNYKFRISINDRIISTLDKNIRCNDHFSTCTVFFVSLASNEFS